MCYYLKMIPRQIIYYYLLNYLFQTSPKLVHRVNQLRQEETIDLINREVAHEREIHSAMQISQSWEDLSIMIDSPTKVITNIVNTYTLLLIIIKFNYCSTNCIKMYIY